jgi:hypothetical protein
VLAATGDMLSEFRMFVPPSRGFTERRSRLIRLLLVCIKRDNPGGQILSPEKAFSSNRAAFVAGISPSATFFSNPAICS